MWLQIELLNENNRGTQDVRVSDLIISLPSAATGTSEKIGNNARAHNNGFDRDA